MATFAEITEILAPNEAGAGSKVNVTVKVKNLYPLTTTTRLIARALDVAGVWHDIIDFAVNIPGRSTYSFSGSFTMPRYTATIWAYSYWLAYEEDWVSDDTKWKNIYLAEEPEPEFRGSLSRKELEYDESRAEIPIY